MFTIRHITNLSSDILVTSFIIGYCSIKFITSISTITDMSDVPRSQMDNHLLLCILFSSRYIIILLFVDFSYVLCSLL